MLKFQTLVKTYMKIFSSHYEYINIYIFGLEFDLSSVKVQRKSFFSPQTKKTRRLLISFKFDIMDINYFVCSFPTLRKTK